MKIFQINISSGHGSTGRIVSDLAVVSKQNGDTVKIAYGRYYSETGTDNVRVGTSRDAILHTVFARLFDNAGFCSKKPTKKLIRQMKEFDPDIIHIHNLHGYYLDVEELFSYFKKCGKPIVWTLHDCWPFTGHCAYFSLSGCEKWKTGCEHCPSYKEYPKCVLFGRAKKNYEKKKQIFTNLPNLTIVTPSQWLANLVKESFLSGYSVEVIPNGIDIDVFKPTEGNFRQKYGLEDKKIVLGVAGVWDTRKGLKDFVALSKLLGKRYRIVLVGLNDKQMEELPDGIIGLRRTNSVKELAEIYSAADVLLNPTYEDNYPTVNLEAQACGTPVITYRTGGSPESVPDENVAEVGNLDEIAKMISSDRLDAYQPERFDKKMMMQGYVDLYHRILSERKE